MVFLLYYVQHDPEKQIIEKSKIMQQMFQSFRIAKNCNRDEFLFAI